MAVERCSIGFAGERQYLSSSGAPVEVLRNEPRQRVGLVPLLVSQRFQARRVNRSANDRLDRLRGGLR
jgi:hypothetical protein